MREDEIRFLFGQEVEPALRALQEAFAREAAGAHGDLGLGDVPARAQRIGLRD